MPKLLERLTAQVTATYLHSLPSYNPPYAVDESELIARSVAVSVEREWVRPLA